MKLYRRKTLLKLQCVVIVVLLVTVAIILFKNVKFPLPNVKFPLLNVKFPLPNVKEVPNLEELAAEKWRQFSPEEIGNFSKLGRILYLDEAFPKITSEKTYKILVWKYGNVTNSRHTLQFEDTRQDVLDICSVKNCVLTYNDDELQGADIVIVHLHPTQSPQDIPPQTNRNPEQIWAFLTDESPYYTFLNGKSKMEQFNGIFNWSFTYRMDADIPVPYGRTISRKTINPNFKFNFNSWLQDKKQDVAVTILGSNCGSNNHRWEYIKELQNHIKIDFYGKCGTLKCPGHFNRDCPEISKYMFYLAFENSNCNQYITEKLWWNAYAKNSIPIILGAPESTYKPLLPPNSYIHIDQFASPKDLASYLIYLQNNPRELERYFEWKKFFKVLNEHGYFESASQHFCRVCEALNYNEKKLKVYNNLEKYWSVQSDCYPAWDKQ